MEFTPEQQAHIDNLIEQSKEGLFTEDDLTRRVTSEVDRRVETGIQKGLETHKSKWQKEFEKQSQLTAEELAEEKLKETMSTIEGKERELAVRENTLEAKSMLAGAEIPKEDYEKFVGILVSGDGESTKENVQNFIDTFNETKTNIERALQEKYAQVPPPNSGGSSNTVGTKEEFNKLTYEEKLEVKETNPEIFKRFIG